MVFLDPSRADLVLDRTRGFFRGPRAPRPALARLLAFAGPTVIASVAYLDPGNFATNITAGATHGYQLLWVVLAANIMAMLFQALSAKLGIVTGRSLARICHDRLPRPLRLSFWVISEIGAIATDLAELLGASIGCALLLGTSLLTGTLLASALSWAILAYHELSFRAVEGVIAALVVIVGLCFLIDITVIPVDWHAAAYHSFVPSFGGSDGVMLAAGIIGATVMPHAVFLHSSVARYRLPAANTDTLRGLVRASNIDVAFTLGGVGLINMAIMCVAAVTFGASGSAGDASIEGAFQMIGPLFGGLSATIFMVSLLASGLSSSVVGTMAGQVIMQDFIDWRIPLWVRRLVTMLPTIAAAAWVADATRALVISQVVLSFVLPIPLIALVLFTGSRAVMGGMANSRAISALAVGGATIVLAINALLLFRLILPD
jgi:manganese transport protein